MRNFLLYLHTGREDALDALHTVLVDIAERDFNAVVLEHQVLQLEQSDLELARATAMQLRDGVAHIISADEVAAGARNIELAIVLGGDGTILRALDIVRDTGIPVHGVNLGHVGFLAESEAADLSTTIDRLLSGDYVYEERSCLDITVRDSQFQTVYEGWAMNDAAIEKANRQKMINVAIEIDSRPVSSFGCDGVLLSSSTGSTAYTFSAGGPVVWPEVEALVLVPLAAHALFARPLVLGRSSLVAVELTLDNSAPGAVLTLDGRRTVDLDIGMRVESRISPRRVRFARLHSTPFADRLVEKFQLPVVGWRGERSVETAAQDGEEV